MSLNLRSPRTATALAALTLSVLASGAARAADPLGTWLNDDKDAIVQIADCAAAVTPPPPPGAPRPAARPAPAAPPSGLLCGTVVWLKNPIDPATGGPLADKKNRDPAQRGRAVLGMQGISEMRPTNTAGRFDGRVYNIDDGKSYDGSLIMRGDNEMRVQGCVLLMCQGETWTRAALPAPPPAAPARQQAPATPQRTR